ncbi:hypothetical protein [Paenibacillus agricola]|uniref:Uncharacterized protein n=1 Tax=Paenibacillus agricola TaxID=2716264 RepID=A0ABX0J3D7_9BACL|nr:hypothetical protein [Paenibacillus agricola]NHN30168.1 hypothetical protein [Paenibacillus agricola]
MAKSKWKTNVEPKLELIKNWSLSMVNAHSGARQRQPSHSFLISGARYLEIEATWPPSQQIYRLTQWKLSEGEL